MSNIKCVETLNGKTLIGELHQDGNENSVFIYLKNVFEIFENYETGDSGVDVQIGMVPYKPYTDAQSVLPLFTSACMSITNPIESVLEGYKVEVEKIKQANQAFKV